MYDEKTADVRRRQRCGWPSVIDRHIAAFGQDYRLESGENPIPALRDRSVDSTRTGREPGAVQ